MPSQTLLDIKVSEEMMADRPRHYSGSKPNPNKLATFIFAPGENETMILMEVARELPDEPDRWKIPQRDYDDLSVPMREAALAMVDRSFSLKPDQCQFWNSLPGPIREDLPQMHRGLTFTNTYFAAIFCPEPYEFIANLKENTRRWFPFNELLHRCQSFKKPAYIAGSRMVIPENLNLPGRIDH